MPEAFLDLSRKERGEIFESLAGERSANLLEKDVWVCWALESLFSMPNRLEMAFKGGTSLSKVYNAIRRFSEDVDVTIDYREFDRGDPLEKKLSGNQRKQLSARLKEAVREHIFDVIVPHLKTMTEVLDDDLVIIDDDEGEKVFIEYPSVTSAGASYVADRVLLEFGGRNITEPNEMYAVEPYIASSLSELSFPRADVTVLSARRTFWEKVTLIHAECGRGAMRANADRMSRHWYDVVVLSDQDIGRDALADRALLESVVAHKKVFFHSGFANYDACLHQQNRLLPDGAMLAELRKDYEAMVDAGMIEGEPPSFDEIVDRLRKLEMQLNR